jgi:hypothetical protein
MFAGGKLPTFPHLISGVKQKRRSKKRGREQKLTLMGFPPLIDQSSPYNSKVANELRLNNLDIRTHIGINTASQMEILRSRGQFLRLATVAILLPHFLLLSLILIEHSNCFRKTRGRRGGKK